MKKILITIGAAAFGLVGASALAGEKKSLEDKFNAVDTDGNGVITEAEFTAQGEKATAEKFAKMAGDDGELTLEELKAYYEKKKAKKKKGDRGE